MDENIEKDNSLAKVVTQLVNLVIGMLIVIIGLVIALYFGIGKSTDRNSISDDSSNNYSSLPQITSEVTDTVNYWNAPDISELAAGSDKEQVLLGKNLIEHTSEYFGEKGTVFISSTNGMNCQNCHLNGGTKIFGNNYSAVASTYPKFRARSGSIENIEKRVNDCFERSLNGKALDTASKEMQAIVAYMKWLGKDVPQGAKPAGSGLKEITFIDRAANPDAGKLVYIQKCQSCHQQNGEGIMNSDKTAFTYPPLWGNKSYNDGAGLYRLSNFAKFVKYNMPLGVTHNSTQLTDEEAWDVAAFVNSQPRPHKDTKKDWPKIEQKPFDHPFGPYKDGFDEKQHKYGPFQPILDKKNAVKKTV